MADIWKSILAVIFHIGEQQCQKFQEVRDVMASKELRLPYMLGWEKEAIRLATERRRGDRDGIQLASGRVVHSNMIPPALAPMFAMLLQAQVTGSMEDIGRCTDACASVPAFMQMLNATGDVLADIYAPKQRLTMAQIWESFFSRTFATAEECITQSRILTPGDVAERMPYLYLGLTSLTALDLIRRSPPEGPFVLALGDRHVDQSTVPLPDGLQFLEAFAALRQTYHAAKLSEADVQQLRKRTLWGDRDDAPENLGDMPSPAVARIISILSSIAIRGSQMATFKAHFDEMLGLIEVMYNK